MHGKNFEKFRGTDNSNFKFIGITPEYYKKHAKYKRFGSEILFDQKDDVVNRSKKDKDLDDLYSQGKLTVKNDDDFTDDTIICRSILEYWVEFRTSEFFRSRDLIENWLLKKCSYFSYKYPGKANKTNYSNRIEQNNAVVVYLLERLRYLGLLDTRLVESKNHQITTEYRFTELGKLVAMILKSKKNIEDYSFVKETYDQVLNYHLTIMDSYNSFCILFVKNCYIMDKRLVNHIIVLNFLILLRAFPNDKDATIRYLRKFPIRHNSIMLCILIPYPLNRFNPVTLYSSKQVIQ